MNSAARVLWQRHGLTALLGLAALACLVALGVETQWGQALRTPLPAANAAARASDMVATLPSFSLAPLDTAFRESGERPLFTPTRRLVPVNTAAAPVMKKGQFKLSGTSVSNELTVAFLLETATGKTVRVAKGKEINGMTLDIVDGNRAVLKLGEETEELLLRTASSPPVARVAVPVPGSMPAGPGATAPGAQPLTGGVTGTVPPPPIPPPRTVAPQPAGVPNPLVPAPGSSQLPGFVMPSNPPNAQAAPADAGTPGQRRRRVQTPPQE